MSPHAPPHVRSPQDIRAMSLPELHALAEELRQTIVATCLRNGGHLGASLGTVELAIALHFAFESPREPIVWDVGHQAYAHKLLTGRWDSFATLRQDEGISGFLSRAESEHDAFGAGHSSTSLSAALAMAYARAGHPDEASWTVAVIGDGGLTAGVALEALNNVKATPGGPLLIVLNDNQMSISANVGALAQVFGGGHEGELFDLFGLDYLGPVDGHNLGELIGALQSLRARGVPARPVLLHVLTQKGKGYAPAEESPAVYHGISPVQEKVVGQPAAPKQKTYSEAFGDALCALAEKDAKIVAITAAMPEGTGLAAFARRFPDRFFDVGIAEPHAVTFAAGLATQGYKPVVAIYSTFLQRALDAIIHDVALQGLGVTLALDRAGLVGADGPTHHGAFDLAYLGMVPGLTLSAPTSLAEMASELQAAVDSGRPWAMRYPRGSGPAQLGEDAPAESGGWKRLRTGAPAAGDRVTVVALGSVAVRALAAAQQADPSSSVAGARVEVIAVTRAKPLSPSLLDVLRAAPQAKLLIAEEGVARGGFGQALLAGLGPRTGEVQLANYGDEFVPHGSPAKLEERVGLSTRALAERLRGWLK